MKEEILFISKVFDADTAERITLEIPEGPGWNFGQVSEFTPDAIPFWSKSLRYQMFYSEVLFEEIVKQLKLEDVILERVYANGQTFGQEGIWHTDSTKENRGWTFLYYCNREWEDIWGGYTWFRDSEGNTMHVKPIPNSGVFFPGWISHYGEAPSRYYKGLRTTVAWKMLPKETEVDRDKIWP